ncbi:MAG: hypothetical protein A2408_01300 [Candidatus Yonathbacteria bacterium RIFOXYC1_FULL_52_10]|uniref:Major facilitator superfamily (MFS) profile domain-containing protein n=1 Tax=Candidatus Yonathbacteria bacterium RIFOXYD1_FULL_52_36 TaxID=1802730 RepID=A0A1G2SJH0_9BACT|nr:MAG: hypothetical protein A2591_03255 [Candidatus Yonathbacteria bacterium RIFOXYD1_FULL_52_36]OHA84999.1 MAG: hypothetical protein A2408_01300 [Candidatus Yonathbacteria bacterium RIFOXYC1_FULL_52_10]
MSTTIARSFSLLAIYAASFLFALHTAATSYINSSFLETFLPEKYLAAVFSAGSILTLIGLAYAPRVLRRLGGHNIALVATGIEILLLAGVIYFRSPLFVAGMIAFHLALVPIISYLLDLFIESASDDSTTGKTRGLYLTVINFAWVLSPLIASLLLTNGDYWKLYIVSAMLMVPVWYLIAEKLHTFKDPVYEQAGFFASARKMFQNRDTRAVFISNFLLWFFYATMIIYMPLYLHTILGFPWKEIGILFTIMLLPFIMLQYPLGRLADARLGEKELMVAGFIIMACSTGAIALWGMLSAAVFAPWAAILFLSRVGASTTEVMNETYFFKHATGENSALIGFFRNTSPLAFLAASLIGAVVFRVMDPHSPETFRLIFLALSVMMLLGVLNASFLRDTK